MVSTVEKELNKFYDSWREVCKIPYRILVKDNFKRWYSKPLAKLLLVNIDDIQAKTKGNLETFLCRLSIWTSLL